MVCKKCGANIADNSKFCGFCGNAVEVATEPVINQEQPTVEEKKQENVEINTINTFDNVDLGETIKIEPIQINEQNISEQTPISPVANNQEIINNSVSVVNNEPIMNNTVENQIPVNGTVVNNELMMNNSLENQVPVNGPMMQNNLNTNKKKNNKLIFIIGVVVLVIVAVVLLVLSFIKSSNNSISVLKKSLANMEERADESITVNGNLSLSTNTGDSFVFNLSSKVVEKDDKMDMQITLEKSLLFDEINAYATITEKEMKFYMQSSLIDMMGMTSSLDNKWIYYDFNLDELEKSEDDNHLEEKLENMKLEDFIDEEHFVYVDEVNDLRHYELIIDQKLIDKIKIKLAELNDEDINESINSMEQLEKTIKIDFYINNKNELSKIELDMTEYLEDSEEISSIVLSIEFTGLNSTVVEIPNDAKNSNIDLETYTSSNMQMNDNYNYDYSYDIGVDTNIDASLNNTVYGF